MSAENIFVIIAVVAALIYAAYWVVRKGPADNPGGCAGCRGCGLTDRTAQTKTGADCPSKPK